MGDIIHAMVALQYIKKVNPSLRIDWIVEQGFANILEKNPHIDNILAVNLKAIKQNKKYIFKEITHIRKYAENNYDLVVDAQGLFKSAIVAKLLGKKRAGFSRDSIRERIASYFYDQKIEIAYNANTIDRNVKVMSEPLGIKISPQMIQDKESFLFYEKCEVLKHLSEQKKNIIFVIGSTWESRNYPKEKFAQLANTLAQNVLIVWGNNEEKERAEWITAQSKYASVLPKINLNDLKAIIGNSDLLIGNDTGPTHMAWGMNVASITLFGPTPVNRVYETDINKVLKSPSVINHYKLNKDDFSIGEIEVQSIVEIAQKLLNA